MHVLLAFLIEDEHTLRASKGASVPKVVSLKDKLFPHKPVLINNFMLGDNVCSSG